jgi:hypothetical protein
MCCVRVARGKFKVSVGEGARNGGDWGVGTEVVNAEVVELELELELDLDLGLEKEFDEEWILDADATARSVVRLWVVNLLRERRVVGWRASRCGEDDWMAECGLIAGKEDAGGVVTGSDDAREVIMDSD